MTKVPCMKLKLLLTLASTLGAAADNLRGVGQQDMNAVDRDDTKPVARAMQDVSYTRYSGRSCRTASLATGTEGVEYTSYTNSGDDWWRESWCADLCTENDACKGYEFRGHVIPNGCQLWWVMPSPVAGNSWVTCSVKDGVTAPPTASPTAGSTVTPSVAPTPVPTSHPTHPPTKVPTFLPTGAPTTIPTYSPTSEPSNVPSLSPTHQPTSLPSSEPTAQPSIQPTKVPTAQPTRTPTSVPTHVPTNGPTHTPTDSPTEAPTSQPTNLPTFRPTFPPTLAPTTALPTHKPTHAPTANPTLIPTGSPTRQPTQSPTSSPTASPTQPHVIHQSDWTDYLNDFEGDLEAHFYQENGERAAICGMGSFHLNYYEDRRFRFKYCTPENPTIATLTGTTPYSDFDDHFYVDCGGDSFISSIDSFFSPTRGDRRFSYECHKYEGWSTGSCSWTDWVNDFDQEFDFACGDQQVMTGMDTYHRNFREDRRFRFKCCRLEKD